jgi:hypothetical protein
MHQDGRHLKRNKVDAAENAPPADAYRRFGIKCVALVNGGVFFVDGLYGALLRVAERGDRSRAVASELAVVEGNDFVAIGAPFGDGNSPCPIRKGGAPRYPKQRKTPYA